MTTPPASTSAGVSHAPDAPPSPPNRCDSDVDEILSLFKAVFGVGVSLRASSIFPSTNSTSALLELNPLDDQDFSRSRIKTPPVQQCSREPLRPYPRSQASSALRVENDHLKAEVEELRMLLAQSRGQVSTLTSLLRDTSSSLDLRSQELEASRQSLEEVAFQAIEAELPEPSSEDLLTRFRIAHSEVNTYREVAKRQKQKIRELRKPVDDATNHLEELEEMVCQYRDRAHVAEGLIRQYPKDEGLYEVELPSLSELQRKLDASEALVRGLLEAITLLLYRGLHHTPECLSSVINFVLGYLSQARFTHGELHLRSTSSLLYYYSNAADRVKGLHQEITPDTSMPILVLWNLLFIGDSFPSTIPFPLLLPAIPALDSIMVSWEHLIANYICDMIDTPGPHDLFPTSTELPGVGGSPSPLGGSVLAEGDGETVPREVAEVAGETGIAVRPNVATPKEEDARELPVGDVAVKNERSSPAL
ncbi:hypothetical protein F5879DRAFT_927424 [Lentinula edodes]|nr:hypothetical protein F5879DRAFT_927424 [Lentinula edodes]